jgi:hypothetical protein
MSTGGWVDRVWGPRDPHIEITPAERNSTDSVFITEGSNCTGALVAELHPVTVGETTIPFDPGLAVRGNSGLTTLDN